MGYTHAALGDLSTFEQCSSAGLRSCRCKQFWPNEDDRANFNCTGRQAKCRLPDSRPAAWLLPEVLRWRCADCRVTWGMRLMMEECTSSGFQASSTLRPTSVVCSLQK